MHFQNLEAAVFLVHCTQASLLVSTEIISGFHFQTIVKLKKQQGLDKSTNYEDQKTLAADRALYGRTDGSHHLVNT